MVFGCDGDSSSPCCDAGLLNHLFLSARRESGQQAASNPSSERSDGSLPLSAAFDILKSAADESAPADAAGAGAARSVLVMGQCLMAAVAQARAQLHDHRSPVRLHSTRSSRYIAQRSQATVLAYLAGI